MDAHEHEPARAVELPPQIRMMFDHAMAPLLRQASDAEFVALRDFLLEKLGDETARRGID